MLQSQVLQVQSEVHTDHVVRWIVLVEVVVRLVVVQEEVEEVCRCTVWNPFWEDKGKEGKLL